MSQPIAAAESEPAAQEVEVPDGHDLLLVRLEGHTWVSLEVEEEGYVRISTEEPTVRFMVQSGRHILRTDGRIVDVTTGRVPDELRMPAPEEVALLRLTSDAPDHHVVDGVGEVPADGTSFCTITLEKVGRDGARLTGRQHNDEIFLRTTGGSLTDGRNRRIRSVKLRSGRASFRLRAESAPRVVTVSVFGRTAASGAASLQVEFV